MIFLLSISRISVFLESNAKAQRQSVGHIAKCLDNESSSVTL